MKQLYISYKSTFTGLSREVWWLALITLINRAGTMIIPFLSLYLIDDLEFSLKQVGWIMTCFGVGSVIGTWLGGKLTDKIGYYKVMVSSLFLTGILFISMQYLKSFNAFCFGIFLIMSVADLFRPAIFVTMNAYSKPENKTRSVTLIRLAINLGFSVGPPFGGIIVAYFDYSGLFWVDGLTCVVATLLLFKLLHPKKTLVQDELKVKNSKPVYSNKPFMILFFAMLVFAVAFFQYFSAMPIYYKDIHILTEPEIGLLLGGNGLIIFLLEMPVISWLENKKYNKVSLIILGSFLTGLSFLVLNLTTWSGVLIIGMFLMTIGEMIAFPFANSYAMDLSKGENQGEYMAMYVMSFSIASVFGFNAGFQTIEAYGYNKTWSTMCILLILCIILLFYLKTLKKKRHLI